MKIPILSCFLVFVILSSDLLSQSVKWYNPWNNNINNLETDKLINIPILLHGANYRIIEIKDINKNIKSITARANKAEIKIFELPEIQDYKGNRILDVMLPLRFNKPSNSNFFLLKITGNEPGSDLLRVKIETDNQSFEINKGLLISKIPSKKNLNLNNWAYFDYSYLSKGLKRDMIKDILEHGNNTLVIPPYYFPQITEPRSVSRVNHLKKYIQYTENKFDFYILFLRYSETDTFVMGPDWKKNLPIWYNNVMSVFNSFGISSSKVLIYPYDEPVGKSIKRLSDMHDFFRQIGIKNDFFMTIGDMAGIRLAKKIEYIQVYSGNKKWVNELLNNKLPKTKIWLYEIPAGSRNYNSYFYHKIGFKAYLYNADGIGVWNYADADKSYNEKNRFEFNNGKANWLIKADNPVRDYSLIYRHKNQIYSSIRWEALAYGMEEYNWLSLYEKKNGRNKCIRLINEFLTNGISLTNWETIKLALIQ